MHFLYQEYLRIIASHEPAVFVMENVKGILSAKVNGSGIFEQIKSDLQSPGNGSASRYRLFSFVKSPEGFDVDPHLKSFQMLYFDKSLRRTF